MTPGQFNSKRIMAAASSILRLDGGKAGQRKRAAVYMALAICLFVGLALIPVNPIQASVQAYQLFWWTVDGGGGNSQGSNYSLSGTIGQPDAGTSQGGTYTLAGGFWSSSPSTIIPVKYQTLLPFVRK